MSVGKGTSQIIMCLLLKDISLKNNEKGQRVNTTPCRCMYIWLTGDVIRTVIFSSTYLRIIAQHSDCLTCDLVVVLFPVPAFSPERLVSVCERPAIPLLLTQPILLFFFFKKKRPENLLDRQKTTAEQDVQGPHRPLLPA